MKLNWYLQKNGKEIEIKEVEKKVKEELKNEGYKTKDVQDVKIYFNADEGIAYSLVYGNEIQVRKNCSILKQWAVPSAFSTCL